MIKHARIKNFTVFDNVELDFCRGINVFIGVNGTGKTHVLKALYGSLAYVEQGETASDAGATPFQKTALERVATLLHAIRFVEVFKPEEGDRRRLIRNQSDPLEYRVEVRSWEGATLKIGGAEPAQSTNRGEADVSNSRCVFIPPGDVLGIYEGFIQLYEKYELPVDRTYYDLCRALGLPRLKEIGSACGEAIGKLEECIGSSVVLKGNRFHFHSPQGTVESHLAAEGHRKVATLMHLIANGSLAPGSILFWDEPEASLNPKLAAAVVQILRVLAKQGVQVFLATHDYLITGELSLAAEYQTEPQVPIQFFAFNRRTPQDPVTVETGRTLADLSNNPILDEFAAHYDREQALMYKSLKVGERTAQ